MIETIIGYSLAGERIGITGPERCASCDRSLINRSPDRKESGAVGASNQEVIAWIYESDDDGHGGGLCEACAQDAEQAPLWLMLAKWQRNGSDRQVTIRRDGVTLWSGTKDTHLDTPGGLLSSAEVHLLVSERPVTPGPARFHLLAGAVETYTRADSDADELAAATAFSRSDECPETERNCER